MNVPSLAALAVLLAAPNMPPGPEGMIFLPAATVETGCKPVHEKPRMILPPRPRRVPMPGFWLDRTEVTVGAYAACQAAGACTPLFRADEPAGGATNDRDQHPVTGVTWDQAAAFCKWAGKRLPSEAEWDRAAQGPTLNRDPFVWGSAPPDCEHVAGVDTSPGPGGRGAAEHNGDLCLEARSATLPVCSRPRGNSKEGVCDLTGNAAEWVADVFVARNRKGVFPGSEKDPRTGACDGPCVTGPRHIVKGGAGRYGDRAGRARWSCQTASFWEMGFRCAKDQKK